MPTIASKLFRSVVPGIVFALVTGGLVLDLLIGDRLVAEFDAVLETKAQALMALTELENGVVELEPYDHVLPRYTDPDDPDYFVMLGPDGEILFESAMVGDSAWLAALDESEMRRHRDLILPNGRNGRTMNLRFEPAIDDEEEGPASEPLTVTLHLAVSREPLDALLASVHLVLIGTGIALIALIVLLARRGIRTTLAPLEQIGEQVLALDPERLDQRLSLDTGSLELERLASRFNEMLERLDVAFNRERRFSADVAHELRTPLAELKTLGEVNARWPDDATLRQSFSADHAAAVARMERTVTMLLALARSETGVDGVDGSIELVALARRCISSLEARARERDVALQVTLPDTTIVSEGETQWRAVLCNLLENAIEYAVTGSHVDVSLTRAPDTRLWQFTIANTTRELAPEDLPLMFERLWRKDASRSSQRHGGLGLPLAKACARQLGVDIQPSLDDDDQLVMTVSGIAVQPTEAFVKGDPSTTFVDPPVALVRAAR